MPLPPPQLPFECNALEPHISRLTMESHLAKHAEYIAAVNEITSGSYLENTNLISIVKVSREKTQMGLFALAAQAWNHSFFWFCLMPGGGGEPTGTAAELIASSFGSYSVFREEFMAKATAAFGSTSTWVWLVRTSTGLRILTLSDQETPIVLQDCIPFLVLDVCDHAYCLDYEENSRSQYVNNFLDHLVNWKFVNEMCCLSVQK